MLNKNNFKWPKFDETIIQEDTINLVVQINGKKKLILIMPLDSSENDVLEKIKDNAKINEILKTSSLIKTIYIKNKIINLILK